MFVVILWSVALFLILWAAILPPVLDWVENNSLDEQWYKKDDHSTWGETPGKSGTKVLRQITLNNISNPDTTLAGGKPKIIELGSFIFEEYANDANWFYMDGDNNTLGKDTEGKYISYNYELDLVELQNNETQIPWDTYATMVNTPFLSALHTFSDSDQLHGFWHLYDSIHNLETDFPNQIISLLMWAQAFSTEATTIAYFESKGLSASEATELWSDPTYGWGNPSTFKKWLESSIEYYRTNNTYIGGISMLQNHFQFNQTALLDLIELDSSFYTAYEGVLAYYKGAIGTDDPYEMGLLQWSNCSVMNQTLVRQVTGDVPPTVRVINQTVYDFVPEIGYTLITNETYYNAVRFDKIASTLMSIQYKYPMTNNDSVLNFNGFQEYFALLLSGNQTGLQDTFHFQDINQALFFGQYFQSLYDFLIVFEKPYDPTSATLDRYAEILGRWSGASLNRYSLYLDEDMTFAYPARWAVSNLWENNTFCRDVMHWGTTNHTRALLMWEMAGWQSDDTWDQAILWTKAALKMDQSPEFSELLSFQILDYDELHEILYDNTTSNLRDYIIECQKEISTFFKCSKPICTQREMLLKQWSSANFTIYPSEAMQKHGALSTDSIASWFDDRYPKKMEWLPNTETILPVEIADIILRYDGFLNQNYQKQFFNSYFAKNLTKTAEDFNLKYANTAQVLFDYLKDIIPGYTPIQTRKAREWINGFQDEFNTFITSMSSYEGGQPILSQFYALSTIRQYDAQHTPPYVMESGRGHARKTRQYVKYYGADDCSVQYSKSQFDTASPNGVGAGYSNVWPEPVPLKGTDGGAFGIHRSKSDRMIAFITSMQRYFELEYKSEHSWFGDLKTYKYSIARDNLVNSDINPANAKWAQYPNGFNGFLNLTSSLGANIFVNMQHCWACEPKAQQMIEYYAWNNKSDEYMSEQIFPHEDHDVPYVYVEPKTGVSLGLVLKFTVNSRLQRDNLFPNVFEIETGKGLYVPHYNFYRTANMSYHHTQENYGGLMFIDRFSWYIQVVGYCSAGALIAIGVICGLAWYRRYQLHIKQKRRDMSYSHAASEMDEVNRFDD